MKRAILIIRLTGYAAGALGVGIMIAARRIPLTYTGRQQWLGLGAGLLVVMFLCFLAGYILYTMRLLQSNRRPESGRSRDREAGPLNPGRPEGPRKDESTDPR